MSQEVQKLKSDIADLSSTIDAAIIRFNEVEADSADAVADKAAIVELSGDVVALKAKVATMVPAPVDPADPAPGAPVAEQPINAAEQP